MRRPRITGTSLVLTIVNGKTSFRHMHPSENAQCDCQKGYNGHRDSSGCQLRMEIWSSVAIVPELSRRRICHIQHTRCVVYPLSSHQALRRCLFRCQHLWRKSERGRSEEITRRIKREQGTPSVIRLRRASVNVDIYSQVLIRGKANSREVHMRGDLQVFFSKDASAGKAAVQPLTVTRSTGLRSHCRRQPTGCGKRRCGDSAAWIFMSGATLGAGVWGPSSSCRACVMQMRDTRLSQAHYLNCAVSRYPL